MPNSPVAIKSIQIAIEIIYKGGKKRMFKLNNPVFRYDALDLQTKLESYNNVFRVNCHTALNKYF